MFSYLYSPDTQHMAAFDTPHFYPSLSWSKNFTFGRSYVNEHTLPHYDKVFEETINAKIKSIMALYH